MLRLTVYAGSSVALASAVVFKAVHERANFFSACVYLSQSNACVIVLVNLLVLAVGILVFGLQRLLYGPLRAVEAEQLYDKAWFAITETCLAMTMFREEIGVWFVVLFISLLVGKVWAWIGEGRIEILEQQPPTNPRLYHLRMSMSLLLSLLFDTYLLRHSVSTVRQQARPNMMVMFAFEFAVLTAGSTSTGLRYLISLREAAIIRQQTEARRTELRERHHRNLEVADGRSGIDQRDDDILGQDEIDVVGWEDKGRWVFYLELCTDLVRLVLYLTFFGVLCVFYGMPIHIIRDVAIAIRSFYKRVNDFVKFKHATRDMNERYPDATADEIGRNDVCIICREPMRPWRRPSEGHTSSTSDQRTRPKKLPCGHILHFACLRSWLERQQICPICRQPVLRNSTEDRQQLGDPQRPPQAAPNQDRLPRAPVLPGPERPGINQDVQGRNGWRRFQIGPLRLDVGAWQDQAPVRPPERVQQGQEGPHRSSPLVNPRDQVTTSRRANPPPFSASNDGAMLQMQIDLIEQQMSQQISSIRATVNHLARVRASQEELTRLHGLNPDASSSFVQVFSSGTPSQPQHDRYSELPPGLSLPEGWTFLPLNRVVGPSPSSSSLGGSFNTTANTDMPASSSTESAHGATAQITNLQQVNTDTVAGSAGSHMSPNTSGGLRNVQQVDDDSLGLQQTEGSPSTENQQSSLNNHPVQVGTAGWSHAREQHTQNSLLVSEQEDTEERMSPVTPGQRGENGSSN